MKLTPKHSRLLATWILTAALVSALAARPTIAGEPDSNGNTLPPTTQQQQQLLTGATLPWVMRLQAALDALLSYLPQTLP